MSFADSIIALVAPNPAIRTVRLIGSRSDGSATAYSDSDFRVEADDFGGASEALPELLRPLEPIAQQWDRLSDAWCWMLMLAGPTKIDLIFPEEEHGHEMPWRPHRHNLQDIDHHFWDWMLWLRSKRAGNKTELVASELEKLFEHLLAPLGVVRAPPSLAAAIESYRLARARSERRFEIVVSRDLENAVAPVFDDLMW